MLVEKDSANREKWENLCAVACTAMKDLFPYSIELKCVEFMITWGVEARARVTFSPKLPDLYILPTGDIELCRWRVNVVDVHWLDKFKERVERCHNNMACKDCEDQNHE